MVYVNSDYKCENCGTKWTAHSDASACETRCENKCNHEFDLYEEAHGCTWQVVAECNKCTFAAAVDVEPTKDELETMFQRHKKDDERF